MDTSNPGEDSSAAGQGEGLSADAAGSAAGGEGIPVPSLPADAPPELKSWAERDRERKKALRALQEAERNELQVQLAPAPAPSLQPAPITARNLSRRRWSLPPSLSPHGCQLAVGPTLLHDSPSLPLPIPRSSAYQPDQHRSLSLHRNNKSSAPRTGWRT